MTSLRGARVLITGATRGVGLAAVRRFAQAGADVALVARGRAGLEEAAAVAEDHGVRALPISCDVGSREATGAAVQEACDGLGGLDVVVVNAAAVVYGPFTEVSPELHDAAMRTTFHGAVNTIRASLPALEASAGTLVVTGSLNARHPLPMFSSYAASKHALRGLLGTLRIELAEQGSPVRLAMVHPGAVNSPLWHQVTSATGLLPRTPPEGYSPDAVAGALLDAAVHPRPEIFLGGETRAMAFALEHGPILNDVALRAVMRWFGSGHDVAPDPGALRSTPDQAEEDGRMRLPRRSLLGAVRSALLSRVS